ncbi:MAG: pentapeptide repeat-containing protein [Chloroflexota bacterium]|nr:pentapeptide repeat-containing protein [Chloroflexota bacterium]
MLWLKRDRWKAGIAVAGMLLLLVLMVWVPVSAVGTDEGALGLAMPVMGTVQATPTEDATITALNKAKLEQEVKQLQEQNEPDLFGWLRSNASILLSTLLVVGGGIFGLLRYLAERRDSQKRLLEDHQAERERQDEEQKRWLKDQEAEREKRAEERFQSAVTGLGDEKEGARIGAAILLRTFLRPGYEQFYIQTFDLAVANLRLRNVDPDIPEPLDTLSQALITVFKEAFPLARSQNKGMPQSLEASGIQLDNAYLRRADLKQVWMPRASLRKTDLSETILSEAELFKADLSNANLKRAELFKTDLSWADLREAKLHRVNLEDYLYLEGTDLRGVKGLTKEQLEFCKAKGAIIDEDTTISPPQSPVSPPPPSQSKDAQTPSTPPAQVSTPPPDTDGSHAPSSQQGPE